MPNASGETCAATFGRQLSLLKLPERVAGGILPPAISHPETCLGKTNERIEVDMTNYRNKQTYYGAVDYHTGEFLVKAYPQGNCDLKIEFQQYLQAQSPEQRLVVVWDGASYHRCDQIQQYLEQVNAGKAELDWQLH